MTTATNGQLTTVTSPLPTSLSTSATTTTTSSTGNRAAIIVGSTTAAMVLILILLAAVFLRHRHKLRKRQALSSIQSHTRQGPREGRGLLAGEDFDDDNDTHTVQMRAYHDHDHAQRRNVEEVWPPPAVFIDPFLASVRLNQEVDLGRIVDDIMGPGPGERRSGHLPPSSSFSSGREADWSAGASGHGTHHKSGSDSSYTGLLDEFGARRQSHWRQSRASSMLAYPNPYHPPGEYSYTRDSATVYDPLPPGAAHADAQESGRDPIVIAPGTYSLRGAAAGPSVGERLAASKPKKSSPLVRAISSASHKMGDTTRLWLNRKVKKGPADEGGSAGEETGTGTDTDVGEDY